MVDLDRKFFIQNFSIERFDALRGISSVLDMSAKRIESSVSAAKVYNNSNSVFIQEYCLVSEFNLLKNHVGPGIYVIPAAKTPFLWFGVIFVRRGIYEGGIFRFSLFIPHSFPECTVSPNLVFESPVFHPQVDPTTHELYLGRNSLSDWRKDVNHLWQLISCMRNIFYNIVTTDGPVNERAAHLYETNRDEFVKLAADCVENSKRKIYDKSNDDPNYLLFDKYDAQIHEPFREILRKGKNNSESEEGRPVSWIQHGSLEPLSKNY